MVVSRLSFDCFVFFALLVLLAEQAPSKQQKGIDFPKFEKSKLTANSTIVDLANLYFEILKPSDKICGRRRQAIAISNKVSISLTKPIEF